MASARKFIPVMFITKHLKLFLKQYCNLPFLAICRSQFPLLIFLASAWFQIEACEIKKNWLIIILKSFIKQLVLKQSLTFLSFSFIIDCCISVFTLSLSKAFVNFQKLLRFDRQAFIVYMSTKIEKIGKYW